MPICLGGSLPESYVQTILQQCRNGAELFIFDWSGVWISDVLLYQGLKMTAGLELLYVLSIYRVISGLVPTYDGAHSWQPYSVTPLGDQTASIMCIVLNCIEYLSNKKCHQASH